MRPAFLLVLLLLSSCEDDRPPAPTVEENAQLDAAERMLNDVEPVPATASNAD